MNTNPFSAHGGNLFHKPGDLNPSSHDDIFQKRKTGGGGGGSRPKAELKPEPEEDTQLLLPEPDKKQK